MPRNQFSLVKGKEKSDAQKKRLYADRAFGCYCHHCIADGYSDAGSAAGEKAGEDGCLSIESSSMVAYMGDVHGGHRWLFSDFSSDMA
jgi:hypothetical protein